MNIDIDEAVSWADGFSDDEEARTYITDRVQELESLPDQVVLYRIVMLEDIRTLNRINLGHHWVDDHRVLDPILVEYLKYECMGEEIDGDPHVIKAVFDSKDINREMTLRQNVINPHEGELFVKACARPCSEIQYITYRDFQEGHDFLSLPTRDKVPEEAALTLT